MGRPKTLTLVLLGAVVLIAAPSLIGIIRGPAATPGVFEHGLELADARERGRAEGKPVLVLVTADWCAPCQALKRGALSDETVAAWIDQRTIPVYLEDGADPDAIASLGIRSYPTTLVIEDGRVLGTIVGNASAGAYLDRLKAIAGGA